MIHQPRNAPVRKFALSELAHSSASVPYAVRMPLMQEVARRCHEQGIIDDDAFAQIRSTVGAILATL